MNEYDIKRLALVLALQAEIEGMKSLNDQRKIEGSSPAYSERYFEHKASELRILANKHNEQL